MIRELAQLRDHVVRTPLLPFDDPQARWGELALKDETAQRTGSFKFRGSLHRLLSLPPTEGVAVTAASTGNHGLALATASRLLGVRADVFVPATTPDLKREAMAQTGASITAVEGDYEDCRRAALAFATRTGAVYVSGFDDPDVIEGSATLFAEVDAQRPRLLDTVFVPVGGGGLLAAGLRHYAERSVRVVGVELDTAPAMRRSLGRGTRLTLDTVTGRAEGLMIRQVGAIPFEIASGVPDLEIQLVTDAEIVHAMRVLWERHGIRAEAAGAAALAAALCSPHAGPDRRALAVVSGGNIDPAHHREVIG